MTYTKDQVSLVHTTITKRELDDLNRKALAVQLRDKVRRQQEKPPVFAATIFFGSVSAGATLMLALFKLLHTFAT